MVLIDYWLPTSEPNYLDNFFHFDCFKSSSGWLTLVPWELVCVSVGTRLWDSIVGLRVCVFLSLRVCAFVSLCVCAFVCLCVCVFVCLWVCTFVCSFVCLYICSSFEMAIVATIVANFWNSLTPKILVLNDFELNSISDHLEKINELSYFKIPSESKFFSKYLKKF